jgi:phosphoribosylcarboxyaminoimidazole (NCAIR) mutase
MLGRLPHLAQENGQPYRFSKLLVEFCLKTTKGGYIVDGEVIVEDLDALAGEEDPIIKNPRASEWDLMHSKKQWHLPEAKLRNLKSAEVDFILRDALEKLHYSQGELLEELERLTRLGFLLLEGAFKKLGGILQDIKFEYGICLIDGVWTLVFADVVDCDSWRLLINGQQYSKQIFRDFGEAGLTESAEKYAYVASLVQQFGIPRQAIVLWRGSTSDPLPDLAIFKKSFPSIEVIEVVESGHKATVRCLKKAQSIMAAYPQGGVFVCLVGRSNGLGPISAAHVEWPVLSFPVTYAEFPDDIHASVHMPKETPNLTVWPADNIEPAVLSLLSASNPTAYTLRRMRIEQLDDPV